MCAIAGVLAIATLAACTTGPSPKAVTAPPPPSGTAPTHPLTVEQPDFYRLPNMPEGHTPVRVGVLLPFSNGSGQTRVLAAAMMKAAQLAVFDAHNPDVLLIGGDEGSTPEAAAAAARRLLDQGAEIIIGPLFSQSVSAVAPLTRDRGVPLIAFSTDRAVGGDGVYLLSFQPETEVKRIVDYAAQQGAKNFAALIPATAYGDHVSAAFQAEVARTGGTVTAMEKFSAAGTDLNAAAGRVAQTKPDAILIADGGTNLKTIAPSLVLDGMDRDHVHFLGTGVWDDASIAHEPALDGAWFAAPTPYADEAFNAKFKEVYGTAPPRLATLAYDAVALAALISAQGAPYKRFTMQALTDPNGFAGVNGIFRLSPDGSSDRGLAVVGVSPDGLKVVNPAPTTFQQQGS